MLGGVSARVGAWTDADLTEVASARRLREHFETGGSGVRYSPEAGFFLLQSGVWRQDKLDEVRTAAQEVAGALWAEAAELGREIEAIEAAGDPTGEGKKVAGPRRGRQAVRQGSISGAGVALRHGGARPSRGLLRAQAAWFVVHGIARWNG
ncbi:hypothetical protein AB0M36_36885 [Actinoplanes sp. NPDC051346]|uniref:hypothetical protein n=1 Tax=Actinoplanes sp. NPDC051346 TaxID=3155048 RepID=UPI00344247CF